MGSRELQGEAAADETGSILHQPEGIAKDRKGGETGMKDFTFVPAANFERSKAEGEYKIIDLYSGNNYSCDFAGLTIDEVLEMREAPDVYVAYKEKSPCGNTD